MDIRLSMLFGCWIAALLALAKASSELSSPVYEKVVLDGKTARISCTSQNNHLTLEITDAVYEEISGIGIFCGEYSVKYAFKRGCDGKAACTIWARYPSVQTRECHSRRRPLKVRYTCSMATESKESIPSETERSQWQFSPQQQQAAQECDENIMNQPYPDDGRLYCSRTFDNWGCWNDTLAGTQARIPCPAWAHSEFDSNLLASKDCSDDGMWAIHQPSGIISSYYTTCIGDPGRLAQLARLELGT